MPTTYNDAAPGPFRGIPGVENRDFTEASLKIDWETSIGTVTSVTGYSDLEQSLFASASWDDPLRPGAIGLAPIPLGGVVDLGGVTLFDWFQDLEDNFESFTQDIGLVSNSESAFRWLIGASYHDREVVNKLNVGFVFNSADGPLSSLDGFPRFDLRNDQAWGVYGQINYDLSDRLELTVAGRYDENNYDTTQYSDAALSIPVATFDESGNPVQTLANKDDQFQPKVTLAYDVSDDKLVYLTYVEGFRFGFLIPAI